VNISYFHQPVNTLLDMDLVAPAKVLAFPSSPRVSKPDQREPCSTNLGLGIVPRRSRLFTLLQGGKLATKTCTEDEREKRPDLSLVPSPCVNEWLAQNAHMLDRQGDHELKMQRFSSAYRFFTQAYHILPTLEREQRLLQILPEGLQQISDEETLRIIFSCFHHAKKTTHLAGLLERLSRGEWYHPVGLYWLGKYYMGVRNYPKAILFLSRFKQHADISDERLETVNALLGYLWSHRVA
jgi:hypothetical protein